MKHELNNLRPALGCITRLEEAIAGVNRAVADRDGQIARLNHTVAERDEWIAALRQYVAQRESEAGALARQLGQLRRQVGQLRRQVGQLGRQVGQLRRQLDRVYASSSWRITGPLRAGGRLLSSWFAGSRRTAHAPTIDMPVVVAPPAGHLSAASGVDSHLYYLNHGREEGRLGLAPQLIASAGQRTLAPDRPTVLVVSHEASRTGAPILAWNICRELQHRCNVIALLLGSGRIASCFAEVCDVVVGPFDRPIRDPTVVGPIVHDICDRYNVDFALVNSIESRAVIWPLAERFVPSVLLIHEFFAYTRPREDFVMAMRLAAAVVFSARLVQRNALTDRTRPAVEASHVLVQGKSVIPVSPLAGLRVAGELARIEPFVRRGNRKRFFVLGAGSVQYRKGVDLFVATAAEVQRLAPGSDVVMLWIGHGFDPEKDLSYSAYVQEQIVAAGLDNVALIDEVENLESVYTLADALLLSSRLDPMPNVAIDAMSLGKPVICFENATGIAEILAHDPRTAECIVPFANIGEAARLILRLQSSPAFADAVSAGARMLATEHFDMPAYVTRLFDLAAAALARSRQERSDAATLRETADFDADFVSPPVGPAATREQAIVSFLRSSATGVDARRAAPGFDGATYARHHDIDGWNSFAHWLRAGRPDGPWRVEVIDPSRRTETSVATTLRRALHIHAFPPDLLDDIVARLGSEGPACDLFVSVTSDADATHARRLMKAYRRGAWDVQVVPNRGRDIGPFLTTFCAKLRAYAVIGHVHTKRSLALTDGEVVRRWREYGLDNLLEGKHPSADVILDRFAEDPGLGIVYPEDPNLLDWGGTAISPPR